MKITKIKKEFQLKKTIYLPSIESCPFIEFSKFKNVFVFFHPFNVVIILVKPTRSYRQKSYFLFFFHNMQKRTQMLNYLDGWVVVEENSNFRTIKINFNEYSQIFREIMIFFRTGNTKIKAFKILIS